MDAVKLLSYAGIGSRKIPKNVLIAFGALGKSLAELGFTLNSGGADGADLAFEKGCDAANGSKNIFIPWPGFNGSKSKLTSIPAGAYEEAAAFRRNFDSFSSPVKKLLARDSIQVLGQDLITPVSFVACYAEKNKNGAAKGGTSMAISIAQSRGIKVINAYDYDSPKQFYQDVMTYAKSCIEVE